MYLPKYAFHDRNNIGCDDSEIEIFTISQSPFWNRINKTYGIINLKLVPNINGFNINEIFNKLLTLKIKDNEKLINLVNVNNTVLLINDGNFKFCYDEKYEKAWFENCTYNKDCNLDILSFDEYIIKNIVE